MAANEYDQLLVPRPANEYDAMLFDQRENDRVALRQSMTAAAQTQPDRKAKVIQLANQTNLPVEVVERNFDEVQKKAVIEQNEYDRLISAAPATTNWLKNPDNAALASDDINSLGYIERQVKNIQNQFNKGRLTTELSDIGQSAFTGKITPQQRRRQQEIEKSLGNNEDYGITGFFEQIPGAVANQLPIFARTLTGQAKGAAAGAAVGAGVGATGALVAGQLGPQIATPEEVITVPAAAAIGAKIGAGTGWRYGAAIEAAKLEGSLAYLEFEKIRDERGLPLDRDTLLGSSAIVGIINGAIEGLTGIETLTGKLPGINKFTRQGFKDLLKSPTVRSALGAYAKRIGGAMVVEGGTEFIQEMVKNAVGVLAPKLQDGSIKTSSAEEIIGTIFSDQNLSKALAEARAGAQAGGGLSVGLAAPQLVSDIQKVKKAKENQQFFTALGEGAANSKTFQRLPQKLQEVVEQATKDTPIENVFVPVDSWVTYWQSQNVDPRTAAQEVYGDTEAYDEAISAGHDLAIPTPRYATTIAPTQHNEFFARELRTAPDELNAREADELVQRLDEQEQAIDDIQQEQVQQQSADRVRDDIVNQLTEAGFNRQTADTYAQLYESTFRSLGQRAQQDPFELYQQYGLRIGRNELTAPDAQVLNQENIPEQALTEATQSPVAPRNDLEIINQSGTQELPTVPSVASAPIPSQQNPAEGPADQPTITLPQGNRGAISFGENRQFNINLLEKADLSTFLHESGHFYLEILGDLAQRENAAPQLQQDFQTLLDWFGVQSRNDIGTEQHEQFARAFEAYLMEGKSPSIELRGAFARFRAWLVSIYRNLRGLNVQLNKDVRAVMDRLVATEQEIEAAEREAEITPLFTTAESAGLTDTEFAGYRKTIEDASLKAKEELQQKLMRQYQREQKQWWKDRQAEVREQVEAEVNQQREYIALSVLQKGTLPDGSALPEGIDAIKLSKPALNQVYDKETLKGLPRGITSKEGVNQDAAAEALGFSSGDELIQTLLNVRPKREVIAAETDVRMREQYGDLLTDGTIAEAARLAVQNNEREQIVIAELRSLNKKQREVRPFVQAEQREQAQAEREGIQTIRSVPPLKVFRDIAAGRISQMRVRDINPTTYLVAARRASKAAFEAAARNEYQGAANAKQRELLNIELYKEATKAREEIDTAIDYLRGFSKTSTRQRIGKAGQDYLDQIDALLERFDLGRLTLKAIDRRKSLEQWIIQKEQDGEIVDLPEELKNEAFRKPYKEMTVEELRGLNDSIKHLAHLARFKNKLLKAKDQRDLEEAAAIASTSIRENAKKTKGKRIETRLPKVDALRAIQGFFASHRKIASLARQMDGFEDGGVMWDLLIRPMNEAGNQEAVRNQASIKRLEEIFSSSYSRLERITLDRKTYIPAIEMSLSKMGRLVAALNWGNSDNRQKLMDGYNWSPSQVEAILDTLDQRDWQFVQNIWDYIDSFWPEIKAKEERVFGLAPAKVEAEPVQTKYGEFKGGYYPLKYDDRQSAKAYKDRTAEAAKEMLRGAYTKTTTRRGHTKARVEGVERQVRLDFGVIREHTQQVIHDLTHHEFLIDANRLIDHKSISDAIYDTYGDIVHKQIKSTIDDIAAGDVPANTFFERAINYFRTGTSIAYLGWNLSTSLLQPLGLTQSITRIGPKWVGRGLSRWLRDAATMENTVAWIHDRSDFMRLRANTQQREISEIRNAWSARDVLRPVEETYFWLITRGQMVADVPTWLGAYEKYMEQTGGDEAKAIALADQAVLDSQGGGQVKDLAQIQRGSPLLKLWTNFYSYFNVTYNRTAESFGRVKSYKNPLEVGRLAVDLLMIYTIPAVLGVLVKDALKGNDDDDELVDKLVAEQLSYIAGTVLLGREVSGVLQGYHGYEGPAGARLFAEGGKLIKQIGQGEVDEPLLKSLNRTGGILLHYPAGQVQRTLEGYVALQEGNTDNPLALIAGPPRE